MRKAEGGTSDAVVDDAVGSMDGAHQMTAGSFHLVLVQLLCVCVCDRSGYNRHEMQQLCMYLCHSVGMPRKSPSLVYLQRSH